jgi:hypothetical protein
VVVRGGHFDELHIFCHKGYLESDSQYRVLIITTNNIIYVNSSLIQMQFLTLLKTPLRPPYSI